MESDKKIILVGYSGHSFALLDIAIELGYSIVGYSENKIKSAFRDATMTYVLKDGSYLIPQNIFKYVMALV